jgi:hypothetical protein
MMIANNVAVARAIKATGFTPVPLTAAAYCAVDGWLLSKAKVDKLRIRRTWRRRESNPRNVSNERARYRPPLAVAHRLTVSDTVS